MADPAQDALLYRPGIRAGAKLLEIVIGFDDKDVGQVFGTLTQHTQTLESLAAGKTCVDEDAGGAAGYQCTVGAAAAGQQREGHCHMLASLPLITVEAGVLFEIPHSFGSRPICWQPGY